MFGIWQCISLPLLLAHLEERALSALTPPCSPRRASRPPRLLREKDWDLGEVGRNWEAPPRERLGLGEGKDFVGRNTGVPVRGRERGREREREERERRERERERERRTQNYVHTGANIHDI